MALKKIEEGDSFEQVVLASLVRRCRLVEEKIKPVMKIVRSRANSSLNFYHNFIFDRSRFR